MRKIYNVFFFIISIWCMRSYSQLKSKNEGNLDTMVNKGIVAYNQGNYENAIDFFKKSVMIASEQKDIKTLCKAYNNLGNCYSNTGNLQLSLKNYQQALQIAEQLKDSITIAKCTKNIGTLYRESGDFKTAINYYNKAEKIALHSKNKLLLADCYNNKAIIYEQDKIYERALTLYDSALQIYKELNNKERLAMAYTNIGIVYKYQKKYPLSISYYKKSTELSKQINDSFMVSVNLNNLANVYSLTGDHVEAKRLLFEAIEMAKKIHATQVLIEALDGLSEEFNLSGNYKTAYKYRKDFETEKFNYINTERTQQLADMEIKYETKKKVIEIKDLIQQSEIKKLELIQKDESLKRRNLIISFVVTALFLVMLSGFLFVRFQRIKNLQKQTILVNEAEENERLRIAKDIHDDLGSGLSKIAFLTEMVLQKTGNNYEIKSNIKSISETAASLVENMRDLIWALNPENTTLDVLIARIREYSSDYLGDFPIKLAIYANEEIPVKKISKEAHRNIFFIVKESMQNIVKHANATDVKLTIDIKDENFIMMVSDNGKGLKESGGKTGNGLKNIAQRAKSLQGEVLIQPILNKEFSLTLTIPLKSILKS